jgi:hypothetical protein
VINDIFWNYPTTDADAYSCIEDIMHGYNTGSLEAIKIYTYQNKAHKNKKLKPTTRPC